MKYIICFFIVLLYLLYYVSFIYVICKYQFNINPSQKRRFGLGLGLTTWFELQSATFDLFVKVILI